jgi:bifunctional non-homologous end joining protein LigD
MVVPEFVEPMKAKLVAVPPKGDWTYEIKFDGFRALAIKQQGVVQLVSRNGKRFQFPEIAETVSALRWNNGILDGEIVALDSKGRSSFQMLQNHALDSANQIFYLLRRGDTGWRDCSKIIREQFDFQTRWVAMQKSC